MTAFGILNQDVSDAAARSRRVKASRTGHLRGADKSMQVARSLRVLVLSESPLARRELQAMLERSPGFDVTVLDPSHATEVEMIGPDYDVVVDDGSETGWGVGALVDLPTVVLGAPTPLALTGGDSYLPADATAEQLAASVHAAAAGLVVFHPRALRSPVEGELEPVGEALTPRELEVLRLVAAGQANRRIAERLLVSEHTVKFHVSSILSKLQVASRTEAVAVAARRGLVAL